jgi:signal recognition particle receptor subunit beta
MVSVNPLTREIFLKIVYYGPGLGGKTTTLQHIHDTTDPNHRGKMVSLATPVERTLYFDYLPVRLPEIGGYALKLQLFTVPGQIHFNATRKLVLSNADGVVFVADSQRSRLEANLESFDNLLFNLADYKIDADVFPIVFNYNKRDLTDIVPLSELDRELNRKGRPSLGTCAVKGDNVYEGLELITKEVIRSVKKKGVTGYPEKQPASPASTGAPALPFGEGSPSVGRAVSSAGSPVSSVATAVSVSQEPQEKVELGKSTKPIRGPLPLEDAVSKITDTTSFDTKLTAAPQGPQDFVPNDTKLTAAPRGPQDFISESPEPEEYQESMTSGDHPERRDQLEPPPDRPTIPAPFALSEKAVAEQARLRLARTFRNGAPMIGTPARFTFVPLWPESAKKRGMEIETAVSERRYLDAIRLILSEVDVIIAVHRHGTKTHSKETIIAMLGLDDAQYRDICTATNAPESTITLKTVLNAYLFLLQIIDKSR